MRRLQPYRLSWALCFALALLCLAGLAGAALAQRIQVEADLSTTAVRTEESNLANVIADALRAVDSADIAFLPAAAFTETTVRRGSASADDLLRALNYRDDTVAIVKLTGAQLRKALEHGLSLYPQKNAAFLQVSGLSVTVDPATREKRVVSVRVGRSALDESKTYTVAMPMPLASGGLAYFKVWGKSDIDHETTKSVADAVSDYLGTVKSLSGKSEERIVFKR